MQVEIPLGAYRYCREPRVRAAVDFLLAGKSSKIPDGLGWDELADFYRACLAAQQAKIEWAMAQEITWTATWADQLGGWTPVSIREQSKDRDTRVDPDSLWNNAEFYREFERSGFYLYPVVELDEDAGLRVALGLFEDGELVPLDAPEGVVIGAENWLYSPWSRLGDTPALDISGLRSAAAAMVAAAESAME